MHKGKTIPLGGKYLTVVVFPVFGGLCWHDLGRYLGVRGIACLFSAS